MIHPETELRRIDDHIGLGVYARKLIPRGTITWALDHLDRVLSPQEVRQLPVPYHPLIERYSFRDEHGHHVFCWDHGRYVNHSCQPSSLPLGAICEVAVRDILPGEQITSDYVTLNLDRDLVCRCGAPACRGVMRPSDLQRYISSIDATVQDVVPLINRVAQPVLEFMLPRGKQRFQAVADGHEPIPSCKEVVGR